MPIDPNLIPDIPGSDPTKKVILGTSPSTTVTLYKNVNLQANYAHIFYWPNKAKQDEYFESRPKQKYNNVTYINLEDGFIRLGFPIKELKGYTYLSFINNNSNYEAKKYYYFITGMKSINNNLTEVYISLDVWNTFYFDITISPCMLVRQHHKDDEYFDSLTPEPIGTGTYKTNYFFLNEDSDGNQLHFKNMGVCVVQAGTWDGSRVVPFTSLWNYNFIVTHAKIFNFQINNENGHNAVPAQALLDFLNTMDGHYDECIAAAYLYPYWATLPTDSDYHIQPLGHAYVTRDLTFDLENVWEIMDTYKPHNRKLYQYPYRLFQAYSSDGTIQNYQYEYFDDFYLNDIKKVKMRQYCSPIASSGNGVEVDTIPLRYKGNYEGWTDLVKWNMDTPLLLTNNNTKKWWDYNWQKVGFSAMTTGIGIAASAIGVGQAGLALSGAKAAVAGAQNDAAVAAANVQANGTGANIHAYTNAQANLAASQRNAKSAELSAVSSGLSLGGAVMDTASGFLSTVVTANSNPPSVIGSFNASPAMAAGRSGVFGRDICLQASDLKRIDTFFDRFGYSVNEIKTPDLHPRKVFTYIQTSGSNFEAKATSYVESTHLAVINSIFDRGVTVWNSEYSNAYTSIGRFTNTVINDNQVERS